MRDPDSLELGGQPLQRALELFEPYPAGLEVAPGNSRGDRGGRADRDPGQHRATL